MIKLKIYLIDRIKMRILCTCIFVKVSVEKVVEDFKEILEVAKEVPLVDIIDINSVIVHKEKNKISD